MGSQRTLTKLPQGYFRGEIHSTPGQCGSLLSPLLFNVASRAVEAFSPTDGKHNWRLFVPDAFSFKMWMRPLSLYLIMHVHSISAQEAKAMNVYLDTTFNEIIWN